MVVSGLAEPSVATARRAGRRIGVSRLLGDYRRLAEVLRQPGGVVTARVREDLSVCFRGGPTADREETEYEMISDGSVYTQSLQRGSGVTQRQRLDVP